MGKRITVDLDTTRTERLEAIRKAIDEELKRRQGFDLTQLLWGDLPKTKRTRKTA